MLLKNYMHLSILLKVQKIFKILQQCKYTICILCKERERGNMPLTLQVEKQDID